MNRLDKALDALPFVAILRGVLPDEVASVAEALVDEGFAAIEVPLNSPHPLRSIDRLAGLYGEQVLVGAGTVLSVAQVDDVHAAGGRLIVSPDFNREVVARAMELGLDVLPGVRTATEAFAAVRMNVQHLKMFPVGAATAFEISALKAVLPAAVKLLAVGGVTPQALPSLIAAKADGFGVGTAVFRPGDGRTEVKAKAATLLAAWRDALGVPSVQAELQ